MVVLALGSTCVAGANALPPPTWAAPAVPLRDSDFAYSLNVQRFNGTFVQRLSEQVAAIRAADCLKALGDRSVSIEAAAAGSVAIDVDDLPCHPNVAPAGAVVTLSARRILALTLAVVAFGREPVFRTNDRSMADYDVEVLQKDGMLKVEFLPAANADGTIAGCPHRGPVSCAYLIDPTTLAILLGRMIC